MLTQQQRDRLVFSLTEYDRKQSTKKGYNHYALAHYFAAIDNVEEYMTKGLTLRQAIMRSYLGRLCDFILGKMGEDRMTKEEAKYGPR